MFVVLVGCCVCCVSRVLCLLLVGCCVCCVSRVLCLLC